MSAHNFWNNFTHGFMQGMFNNSPFSGCLWGNWGCNMSFNSCFTPMFNFNYMVPNAFAGMSFNSLMPDMSPPSLPNISMNMNELFPTDNWMESAFNNSNFSTNISNAFSNSAFNTNSIFQTNNWQTSLYNNTYQSSTNNNQAQSTGTHESARKSGSAVANLKGKYWTQMTDAEMKSIYGDYSRDITTLYTGSAEDLNKYLKGQGKLEGLGQTFIDAQNKYGISAAVLVGIAMNESGRGRSNHAKNKNNVGGVRIPGSTTFKTYNSVSECIMDMARFLKSGYVNNSTRSLTKLYQINAKYCPTSDPTDHKDLNSGWARAVEKFTAEVERV